MRTPSLRTWLTAGALALGVFLAKQAAFELVPRAWAQTACTISSVSTLQGYFADNVSAGSIVPAYVRDIICSSVNFSLTPAGSGYTDTIGNFFADIFTGSPNTLPVYASTLNVSTSIGGAGFTNYLAAPPAIGGATPNTGAFTSLSATGNFTPSQTNGIVGTTVANNANTGSYGEYLTAASSSVNVTSGSANTPTGGSVSLTSGDWEIWSYCSFAPNGTALMTQTACGANTTSATFGAFFQNIQVASSTFPVSVGQNLMSAPVRTTFSTGFTAYCIVQSTFSGASATVGATCNIFARRIR